MSVAYLHQHDQFDELCQAARGETKASLSIVEKDYWIMHVIYSLSEAGFDFEMKGGTSLSKGWGLINRFSEDVDIHIHPPAELKVYSGKNHDKPKHIESRNEFFNWLTANIEVLGASSIWRDPSWDDKKIRNCGIKVEYNSQFALEPSIKPFILLEVGFAQVEPNEKIEISSWIFDIATKAGLEVFDNRARAVKCYLPEYTFVEKLSAIRKKYAQEQADKILPSNFIRHYYDIYQLLGTDRIQSFLESEEYKRHKEKIFKTAGVSFLEEQAFLLSENANRARYEREYQSKAPMYYQNTPSFGQILERIHSNLAKL